MRATRSICHFLSGCNFWSTIRFLASQHFTFRQKRANVPSLPKSSQSRHSSRRLPSIRYYIFHLDLTPITYADDLLLLSESWQGLRHSMNKLGYYSEKWRLGISSKRIKITVSGTSSKGTELTHNIGNVMVKRCQEYPYLGTIMTPSNSFAKCKVHLFKQANKAMRGFLKEVNTQNGGKASNIIKLFNSLAVPVLL